MNHLQASGSKEEAHHACSRLETNERPCLPNDNGLPDSTIGQDKFSPEKQCYFCPGEKRRADGVGCFFLLRV
jgi:hypothetical protein